MQDKTLLEWTRLDAVRGDKTVRLTRIFDGNGDNYNWSLREWYMAGGKMVPGKGLFLGFDAMYKLAEFLPMYLKGAEIYGGPNDAPSETDFKEFDY
jgi:hypothetical protein